MNKREAFRIFMKHQIEFGIEEGIINSLGFGEDEIDEAIQELEDDPDFHERFAEFLEEELSVYK